jgi:hypothetical protein
MESLKVLPKQTWILLAWQYIALYYILTFLVTPSAEVAFIHTETLTFTANPLQMLNTSFATRTTVPATGMAFPGSNAMPVCEAVFFEKRGVPC